MFNFVFLIGSAFVAEEYTGDLLLSGTINREKNLEGYVIFTEKKNVSFIFRSSECNSRGLIDIALIDPNGKYISWNVKMRRIICNSDTKGNMASSVFTPEINGKYHINIDNSSYPAQVKVISGMVDLLRKPYVYFGSIVLWFIGLMSISHFFNHEINNSSKNQVLIALLASLIITYATVQYVSM